MNHFHLPPWTGMATEAITMNEGENRIVSMQLMDSISSIDKSRIESKVE